MIAGKLEEMTSSFTRGFLSLDVGKEEGYSLSTCGSNCGSAIKNITNSDTDLYMARDGYFTSEVIIRFWHKHLMILGRVSCP